ncbi:MAG: V-type ATPase subunit [Candidatus Heimdallarchaeota archaeon]
MSNISPDIGFLTSYIRGQYAKLISREEFENLINKPYEAFINEIKMFDIGEKLKDQLSYQSHEIERLLTSKLIDQYEFIIKNTPKWAKNFIEAYTTKFEVMNIQRLIRYLYSRAEIDLREVINLRAQEMLGRTSFIAKLLQSDDLASLLEELKKSEYRQEIEVAEQLYSRVGDIWPFEFAIESFYLKKMLGEANKLKRNQKEGAIFFVKHEILQNLLLVILKADFVDVDIEEALNLLPLPDEFFYKNQIVRMMEIQDLQTDLKILKTLNLEKITNGIELYEKDKMFLHIEIGIKANELEAFTRSFHHDFGMLSILCYIKHFEIQIQDLTKLLYLKEYKFPIEKTRELIINLV